MTKTLYISRGLPGSGKSTLIHNLVGNRAHVVESDDYFMVSDVAYVFDPAKLPEAHLWARGVVEGLLRAGAPNVGVANTNSRRRDMAPYLGLASSYDYQVQIVQPTTAWAWDVDACFMRNVHAVPRAIIQRMHDTFEA